VSFLDGVVGEVSGMLSGNQTQTSGLVGSVLNMINTQQPGGLAGLVQTFKDKGLGEVVSSWVSTGPNHSISPEQIQQVLGNQKLQEIAAQHGLDLNQVSTQLAQLLPAVVDKLTPQGTIPQS
jgi:uncharacterized protein YidB (DUF937 family)